MEYDVFISYSTRDYFDEDKKVIPNNLISLVKQTLADSGISYWFDEEGIYSGQDFVELIVNNIAASKIFLFLSSENSNNSRWTCKEIASADELGKHIIPVRLDPSPYNGKVLFRIADLDFIELHTNPAKGLQDMVHAIKTYLEQVKQKQLMEDLRRKCETLKNKGEVLKHERENLLSIIRQVTDEKQKQELLSLIDEDGYLLLREIDALKIENEQLKAELDHFPDKKRNPIATCFRKYALFPGRANRKEFWLWALFFVAVNFLFIIMLTCLKPQSESAVGAFFLILNFALLMPTVSVAVRRCHDTNHKGWWLLVPIYNIVLLCMPSAPEENVNQ